MAAGLSAQRQRQIEYRKLKSIQRDLEKAGVEVFYRDRQLTDPSGNFRIDYYRLDASNGEAALLPRVRFAGGELYKFLEFDKGIEILKSRFGKNTCNLSDPGASNK